MARIDLHLHTTYSDGSLPPSEVVALAHKAGVSTLAITDHDITDGITEAMNSGKEQGIEVIPGIEISSRFQDRETHILGYFLNWNHSTFQSWLINLRETRHHRNTQIVENLNRLGLSLSYEDVQATAGSGAIGRPHIAQVLLSKRYVKSAKEAFDRYLADRAPTYVPRELPDAKEAIDWVRSVGGVSVLAHPNWAKEKGEGIQKFCENLKTQGLQGIEVFYSTHTPRQTSDYLEIARRLELLVTGGSDFHGLTKPDIEIGIGRGNLKVPEKLVDQLREAAGNTHK